MRNSLRLRLTLIFIGLAIIPLIVVGGILLQTTQTAAKAQATALESQVAQSAASRVADYYQGLNQDLYGLGNQIQIISTPDRTQYVTLLNDRLGAGNYTKGYEELTLLDAHGKEIARASLQAVTPESQLLDHSKMDDYLQPASTHQIYYGPIDLDSSTGQPYFTMSVPLFASSGRTTQLSEVLIAKIGVSALDNVLSQARPGMNQTLYITDAEGKAFAYGQSSFHPKNAHVTLPPSANIQNSVMGTVAIGVGWHVLPPSADIQNGINHTSVVLAANKVQLNNQTIDVVAEQPTSVALSLVNNLTTTLTIAILLALIFSAAAGFVAVRQIVFPIENLATMARKIAQGDISQISQTVSIRSRDEIGALATAFNEMTSQLQNLVGSLEQRVSERTRELEGKSLQIRLAAEIARDISSTPNLEELLTRSSELIVERFGFYHVGIFFLDDKKEYAVLRASPTEAGKQLLANNHRLQVGEQGIVGRVAATGEARIALDTGADAVYFNNPYLPNTRSEMALPLKTSGEIFGVLDIQSDQSQAFTQDDVEIMQVLSDQLAVAIERIRLLRQVQSQFKEIEQAYQSSTQEAWQHRAHGENRVIGYKFDGSQLQPINAESDHTQVDRLPPDNMEDEGVKTIPIQLRGQTIGSINVRFRDESTHERTTEIIGQIVDRLATALDNARLAEEARQRAERERAITDISTKISTFSDIDAIMRLAVEELGRQLGSSTEVTLELGNDHQEQS